MLKLHNTLSRKKEIFRPRGGKKVNLFVCGPTVYDSAHLGHARTYLVFDMIAKYLKEKGYNVYYLQNITDLDDKIINRAKEKGISPQKLARNFEKEYREDMKTLKITSVSEYARATDYIKEIISQTERLLKKGYAYQIEDGIYYDISKFKDYGKLSRRTAAGAEDAISRIDEAINKKNKGDFCLWKFSKPDEPKWQSPWGWGRPGWHIEDTAITESVFGPQYDIHGGAKDLIFPHHEAEISQMEALSGKPLVKYWIHPGFLKVNGQKMSKSLGNFITIRDFLKQYSPSILRFFIFKSRYGSDIDLNREFLLSAKGDCEYIWETVEMLKESGKENLKIKKTKRLFLSYIFQAKNNFKSAMEDDFNTPNAMEAIFTFLRRMNFLCDERQLNPSDAKKALYFLKQTDRFFNFIFWPKKKEKIPAKLLDLVKQRQKYREQKEWQRADEIREEIIKLGWIIEDTGKGPKIKRLQ